MSKLNRYDLLKTQANIQIELLLDYWRLEWRPVPSRSREYDIIAKWRSDQNFGACRYNADKGYGRDFAGASLTETTCAKFGNGFSKDDFYDPNGFDIINLCRQANGLATREEAAETLTLHLTELNKIYQFKNATTKEAQEQLEKQQRDRDYKLKQADRTWRLAQRYEGTLGDKYLQSRNIHIRGEPNIKFLHRVRNTELNGYFPCLIFKVSQQRDSDLAAIHRIYLDRDGNKLRCENPKIALGNVAGNAIWFGSPGEQLCIAEGPENALSIRCLGYSFVASSINASNFSGLMIPNYVKEIILFPDPDVAGRGNAEKAVRKYGTLGMKTKVCFPPSGGDWNDALMGNI